MRTPQGPSTRAAWFRREMHQSAHARYRVLGAARCAIRRWPSTCRCARARRTPSACSPSRHSKSASRRLPHAAPTSARPAQPAWRRHEIRNRRCRCRSIRGVDAGAVDVPALEQERSYSDCATRCEIAASTFPKKMEPEIAMRRRLRPPDRRRRTKSGAPRDEGPRRPVDAVAEIDPLRRGNRALAFGTLTSPLCR